MVPLRRRLRDHRLRRPLDGTSEQLLEKSRHPRGFFWCREIHLRGVAHVESRFEVGSRGEQGAFFCELVVALLENARGGARRGLVITIDDAREELALGSGFAAMSGLRRTSEDVHE